jgi:hypothetical protein
VSAFKSASQCSAKVGNRIVDTGHTAEEVTGFTSSGRSGLARCRLCSHAKPPEATPHPLAAFFYRALPLRLARCSLHSTSQLPERPQFHHVLSTFRVLAIFEACLQGGPGITRNKKRRTATPGLLPSPQTRQCFFLLISGAYMMPSR